MERFIIRWMMFFVSLVVALLIEHIFHISLAAAVGIELLILASGPLTDYILKRPITK